MILNSKINSIKLKIFSIKKKPLSLQFLLIIYLTKIKLLKKINDYKFKIIFLTIFNSFIM